MGSSSPAQGRCPPGYYCPEGTIQPVPCDVGTYQPNYGGETCLPCPMGHYCDEKGIDSVLVASNICDPGYYCISGAVKPSPTDDVTGRLCYKGHYCTGGAAELPCPAGTYESRNGS